VSIAVPDGTVPTHVFNPDATVTGRAAVVATAASAVGTVVVVDVEVVGMMVVLVVVDVLPGSTHVYEAVTA
jgi:hypothetical protein